MRRHDINAQDQIAMHFRVRLNSVQLVRTNYDAEKKRGRYEVIGSIPQRALVLPEALAARLTPEERHEFETFAVIHLNATALQAKVHALQIVDIVQQALAAAEASTGSERAMMTANLANAGGAIRAFLNRRSKA